uniref:Uncharacterized protein n=1 Tax=Ciona intestinalis TaxID=7719 RepID=H2XN83_CIOIN
MGVFVGNIIPAADSGSCSIDCCYRLFDIWNFCGTLWV